MSYVLKKQMTNDLIRYKYIPFVFLSYFDSLVKKLFDFVVLFDQKKKQERGGREHVQEKCNQIKVALK